MKRTNEKFKWLTRLVLHTCVCYALALFQVIPEGFVKVHADDVLNDAANTTTPAGDNSSSGSGGLTQAPQEGEGGGSVSVIKGDNKGATGKFLFANIGLFAIGLTAPKMVYQCANSWSVRIYAASSALYVLNEIGLFTRFNDAINKEMVAYLGRGDEDKQIESLETAAAQTRKAKEAAERRAMIAKITAAGFGVAAAVAAYEAYKKFGANDCTKLGAFNTLKNSPSLYVLNSQQLYLAKDLVTLESSDDFSQSIVEQVNDPRFRDYNQDYFVKKSGLLGQFKNSIMANAFADQDPTPAGPSGTDRDAKIVKAKDGNQKIVVNTVGAKLAAVGLGAAGALAISKMATGPVGDQLNKMVKSPVYRAVGFGAFSITAFGAANESSEAAKKLGARANEYQRLADSLRGRVDQSVDTGTGGTNQFIDQSVQGINDKSGNNIGNNSVCATGGAASGLKIDKNCSCAATQSCASPQIPNTTGLPNFAGTSLLADSIGNLNGSAQNLFAGNLKEATTKGQALTNNAARITKLRDALQKKFNEDRVKAGGKEIDFEKAEAGFNRNLANQIDSAFNNLTPREQAALGRLGSGFGMNTNGDKEEEKKEGDLADKDKSKNSKVAAVDVNPNAGKANDKNNQGAVWDFNFEDEEAAKAEQEAIAAALAEKEDENYQVEGDINDDRNKNLFNIITSRYLKSAYPVIFEEQ